MKSDNPLEPFENNRKDWEDRFSTLIDLMINSAYAYNMTTCAARIQLAKDGIIDLLVTGSGKDK